MRHMMVDLETLGKGPRAAIVQIGAVEFGTGGIGREFSACIDVESAARAGLEMDPSTVLWWLRQSDAARAAVFDGARQTLSEALDGFRKFFAECGAEFLWGNGATFDNVILTSAYEAIGQCAPQHFRDDRDMRTFKHMMAALGIDPQVERTGTAHDGLSDARNQARWMSACLAEFATAVQKLKGDTK